MKLIVISSANKSKSEVRHIIGFFENGLDIFHIKKKGYSRAKMKEYIEMIPNQYYDRLVLHSHYDLAKKFNLRGIHISRHKKRKKFVSNLHYYIFKILAPSLKISKSHHSI
ncbi:MAG: hypothetical protein ACKVJP_02205, partial [Flavobacteriales bacterium]